MSSRYSVRREENHASRALGGMASLRLTRSLCDVTLKADNQQFEAHRVVLAASSAYFRAMFAGEMEESRQRVVTIKDVPGPILGQLVDYCYTSSVEVTEENVQALLAAAGRLQLPWVQEVTCEFLQHRLEPSNCLAIASLADTHSCPALLAAAEAVALHSFSEVVKTPDFLELPATQLVRLLDSDELNVEREEEVYAAVIKWIRADLHSRKPCLPELLKCVRLSLLERRYLVIEVGMEPLIRSCDTCRDLVDEAKDFLLLPERRASMAGPRMCPRRRMRGGETLVVVGGWCNGDAIATVEMYSTQHDDWKVVATMTKRRCGVGVANLNDCLYAVCGHDGTNYMNSVECYDPKSDQWSSKIASTACCRTSVGVAVLGGCMYSVGGQDGLACLSLVERYDPKANKWQQVKSMTTPRLGVGVASAGSYLYAVGGSDGDGPLASTERYDPVRDEWSLVCPMSVPRKHLGAAVLDGLLYAVGGRNQATELSSVERYDPGLDQWSSVVPMTCCRSGVGLAVVNSRLYAVGGFDGASYLKSVEWLDKGANEWKLAGSMSYRRLGCGVGVVWTS